MRKKAYIHKCVAQNNTLFVHIFKNKKNKMINIFTCKSELAGNINNTLLRKTNLILARSKFS